MSKKKIPSDPDFEYHLWIEDGKKFMRIKATGEWCEVNTKTFQLLRAEEMRVKREKNPNIGRSEKEQQPPVTVLSLDVTSNSEWLADETDYTEEVETKILQEKFAELLTDNQKEIYLECIVFGMSYTEFAQKHGITEGAVRGSLSRLRNQAKKFFDLGGTN